jgi:hypothetical protein
MHIPQGFQIRQILDETLAVPSGEASKQFSGIISLNEVGTFLFEQLQSEQTEESLICALLESYDVDRDTAVQDVEDFLRHLRAADLLIE